jgi:K+/H+ antiporter YhaU regulatory subunit KhtT
LTLKIPLDATLLSLTQWYRDHVASCIEKVERIIVNHSSPNDPAFCKQSDRPQMQPSLSEVSRDIEEIASLLSHVVTLSDRIGSFSDGPHLREQIQNDVRRLTTLTQKVKTAMTELRENQGLLFESYQSRFEDLRSRMERDLKPVIEKLRKNQIGSHTNDSGNQPETHIPLLSQTKLDQDSDLIDVLEQQVSAILQTMRRVNELFGETMMELQQQRHKLLAVEGETTRAMTEMTIGNEQIEKAATHQKSTTKCICWIVIIVIVVLTGVGLIIAWKVFWSKDDTPTPSPSTLPENWNLFQKVDGAYFLR